MSGNPPLKCNLLQAPQQLFELTDEEYLNGLGAREITDEEAICVVAPVFSQHHQPAVQFLDDNNAHTTKPHGWRAIAKPQAATPIGGGDRTDKWWAGLENCDGFNVVCVHPNNGNVLKGQLLVGKVSNVTPVTIRKSRGALRTILR